MTGIERAQISATGQVEYSSVFQRKTHDWDSNNWKRKSFYDEMEITDKCTLSETSNKRLF
jgi:hypothetical protein